MAIYPEPRSTRWAKKLFEIKEAEEAAKARMKSQIPDVPVETTPQPEKPALELEDLGPLSTFNIDPNVRMTFLPGKGLIREYVEKPSDDTKPTQDKPQTS